MQRQWQGWSNYGRAALHGDLEYRDREVVHGGEQSLQLEEKAPTTGEIQRDNSLGVVSRGSSSLPRVLFRSNKSCNPIGAFIVFEGRHGM
jgi:hypothetical protein